MRNIKLITGGVIALLGSLVGGSMASAYTTSAACVANGYPVTNLLDYDIVGSNWNIRYILYIYSPYNALSTHNNLNERLYNSTGGLVYAYDSMDNLVRDGQMRSAHYFTNPLTFSVGQTLRLTNIIDVPNAADPQCTTSFYR